MSTFDFGYSTQCLASDFVNAERTFKPIRYTSPHSRGAWVTRVFGTTSPVFVRWLPQAGHFFWRPLYSQLVMIDLDGYSGTLDRLLLLQPRAVVETSPGSLQMWLAIDQRHAPKDALTVTRELTHALHGDPACIRTTQVGRLPGSVNCKPAKNNRVKLLYAQIQNMSEEAFMQLTKEHHSGRQKPVSSRSAIHDLSASDWKMVCEFFEEDPTATVDTALTVLSGHFAAVRPNQACREDERVVWETTKTY